jgi:plasmid maintenance system antidote protein VapI
MPTLQELRKQANLTNYKIGRALGVSETVASHVIQGRHLHVYHDEQIAKLAEVLGVTFERCWMAMQESYNLLMGYPPDKQHQRADELRAEVRAEMGLTVKQT